MQKRKLWFSLTALAAAWCFDFLFWGHGGGVSLLVWTVILLAAGYLLAWREKIKPSFWSIVLSVLILGFAAISAWRSELFTRFTSVMMAMSGFLLLVTTFTNGHWLYFRVADYFIRMAQSLWAGMSRGFKLINTNADGVPHLPGQKTGLRKTGSVLLGIAIALPIVIILATILAKADPVFEDLMKRIFSIENLPEYLFRFTYVVIGAYVLTGLFLHAVLPEKAAEKPDPQRTGITPFLGWTESSIVLGAVNLLFIAFIIIQVRYLFGGTANINELGYTYASYARRGFSELVIVAVLSLGLYLVMHAVTKRETRGARVGFSVLAVLMLANVLVILASSLQRLYLYETAYSFSELRTYTHVFIFWLAGLIVTTIVLELISKKGHFGLALLIMTIGYTASLGLMNVDGFVARQNIQNANAEHKLDIDYLSSLTSDMVPVLVDEYLDPAQSADVKTLLGVQLACRTQSVVDPSTLPWQSRIFGEMRAYDLLQAHKSAWSQYQAVETDYRGWVVNVGDTEYPCDTYRWAD